MMTVKAKKCLIFALIILLSSCSYRPIEIFELTPDTPGLRPHMKAFLQAEDQGYVKGNVFQAKLFSCTKVIFDSENYDTSYTDYVYQLAIAPITNKPVHIKKIHFSITSKLLEDYYREYRGNGRDSIFDDPYQIGAISPDIFHPWLDETQMIANQFNFHFTNMGDDRQSQANISPDVFDEGMQELKITIHYNDSSETLILKYTGDLVTVRDVTTAEELDRPEIMELHKMGSTRSCMFPYEEPIRCCDCPFQETAE